MFNEPWRRREAEQRREGCGLELLRHSSREARVREGPVGAPTPAGTAREFREWPGIWQNGNLGNYLKDKEEEPRQRKQLQIIRDRVTGVRGQRQHGLLGVTDGFPGVQREGEGDPR